MHAAPRACRSVAPLLAVLTALLVGCPGDGNIPTQISGQIVDENESPLGPGLIMIESGNVHDGAYILGGHIDASGRFSVELPGAGTYGLHLFVDDYQYVPAEIEIEEHQQIVLTSPMISWGVWMDLSGQHAWPTQPDDSTLTRMPVDENAADNPLLDSVAVAWDGDILRITAEVSDPDDDLSRMVLMYDEATGVGYSFVAPGPADDRNNFPQGTWVLDLYGSDLHVPGESMLQFVVSDNLCNDTPLLYVPVPER